MDECFVSQEENDRIKRRSGRPRKKPKVSGEYTEYEKARPKRVATHRDLRLRFRAEFGIKPYMCIKETMGNRAKMREHGYTEIEIERIAPLPRVGAKPVEHPTIEKLVVFEGHVPEMQRNIFSTESALYNVTKIVTLLVGDVLHSMNDLSNPNSLIFYSRRLPKRPTPDLAQKAIEKRQSLPPSERRNNLGKSVELGMRTHGEEVNHLMSIYNKEMVAFKTEVFRAGCKKYYENAQVYEATAASLQHIVNKLAEHRLICKVNPLEEYQRITHEMILVAERMFHAVHFGEPMPALEQESITPVFKARDRMLESVAFIKKNTVLLSKSEMHVLNMQSPNHNYRMWEL